MLQILLMMFIAMAVIGGLGVAFMYLAKSPKVKNGMFYTMAVFGVFIAFISASSQPSNFIMEIAIAVALGALSIVGVIAKLKMADQQSGVPKHLVAASVILGMLYLFF